jgi:hypothetical protein
MEQLTIRATAERYHVNYNTLRMAVQKRVLLGATLVESELQPAGVWMIDVQSPEWKCWLAGYVERKPVEERLCKKCGSAGPFPCKGRLCKVCDAERKALWRQEKRKVKPAHEFSSREEIAPQTP